MKFPTCVYVGHLVRKNRLILLHANSKDAYQPVQHHCFDSLESMIAKPQELNLLTC